MKVSMLAKSAAVALVFGLVALTPAHAVDLQGSGASFPANLIEACKAPFATSGSGHTYTYASSSSGTGQKNSDNKIGDFWMSDGAYTASTKRSTLIHVPLVAAPIAILHNLPSRKNLSLSASTIAGIFGGTITRWDDPAIVADNNFTYDKITYKTKKGVLVKNKAGNPVVARTSKVSVRYTLPKKPIKVIYRSDSSGTSENFTNYLNKAAGSVWSKAKNKVFKDSFPGDINSISNLGRVVGAASSTGVSQLAGKTLINASGNAVAADSTGVSAFLASADQDANGFLTFDYATKEKGAYPLGIVSYLLADTAYGSKTTADAVKAYANFVLSSACAKDKGTSLGFSVIDGDLLKKSQAQVAKIG
jgi:phosphate transport system substrate-binding protein